MSSSMISETDKLNKENVASGRQLQIDFIIQSNTAKFHDNGGDNDCFKK